MGIEPTTLGTTNRCSNQLSYDRHNWVSKLTNNLFSLQRFLFILVNSFAIFTEAMSKHHSLNILFVSSWYPSTVHSTLGNFVQRHAKAVALNNRVDVLYVAPDDQASCSRLEKNNFQGVNEWIQYFPKRKINRWKRKSEFKKLFNHFLKDSGRIPDLVHLNVIYPAGNQARMILEELDIPYVITEHWTGYHPEHRTKTSLLQKTEMKKTAELAGMICPVSKHLQEAMTKPPWKFKGPFTVIPNVVDTDLFQPSKNKVKGKKVLHVSSLVDDHKNISGLIEVMGKVMKNDPEVTFSIIGDGNINPYIEKAEQQNLDMKRFSIEGEKSLQEIASSMAHHDLFVLFSRYENLPCVILEAFAAGIPVVSSNVGGIAEHLPEERGFLVKSMDHLALEKAIERAFSHKWDHNAIRGYAEQNFSENSIADQFSQVYHKVIAQHK